MHFGGVSSMTSGYSRAVVGSREIATRLQEERNLGASGTWSIR